MTTEIYANKHNILPIDLKLGQGMKKNEQWKNTRQSQHCSPCLRSALSCFQLPVSFVSTVHIGINYVNVWHSLMTKWHRIKVMGCSGDFRSSVVCGREEFPLAHTLFVCLFVCFLTLNIFYMNKNLQNITHAKNGKRKNTKYHTFKLSCYERTAIPWSEG